MAKKFVFLIASVASVLLHSQSAGAVLCLDRAARVLRVCGGFIDVLSSTYRAQVRIMQSFMNISALLGAVRIASPSVHLGFLLDRSKGRYCLDLFRFALMRDTYTEIGSEVCEYLIEIRASFMDIHCIASMNQHLCLHIFGRSDSSLAEMHPTEETYL